MIARTAPLALLLCACSAATDSAGAGSPAAVVEVPTVEARDAGPVSRPGQGLRLVYQVSPATEEAAQEALGRARERIDAIAVSVPISLQREGLAVVLELGPCDEADARLVKSTMVARGGLAVAALADEADPLSLLRNLPPPPGIEVDTESAPVGPAGTTLVVYAHVALEPGRAKAARRLLDWVRATVPGIEGLVVGATTIGGRARLRTFVLAEEPRRLEVSEVTVVDDVQPAVEVRLTSTGASVFARETRDNVFRRVAVLVDGEVQIAPQVMEQIDGGRLRISLGAGAEPARDAEELARRLRLGEAGPALELAREETFGD